MSLDAPTPPTWAKRWGWLVRDWMNSLGRWKSFTPSWTNITMSATSGKKTIIGDTVHFIAKGTVSAAATSFITLNLEDLPDDIAVGIELGTISWVADVTATGVSYTAVGFVDALGALTARRASDAGVSGAWQAAVPAVFAVGDVITVSGTYPRKR